LYSAALKLREKRAKKVAESETERSQKEMEEVTFKPSLNIKQQKVPKF
jgi:hypothetical protein